MRMVAGTQARGSGRRSALPSPPLTGVAVVPAARLVVPPVEAVPLKGAEHFLIG